ncbi:MAG: hypothetical protein AVDCRST_MAG96-3633 [uncultured Segetibacter sp.]|uniref:Uncharacterized protein n=1 Tax=uncultured Segetibacter sp. TaxID=481133 RepID=A0A6J4TWB1_9BACT|nr:MAG: hypothetical protein AVDCRST_MAG96-3633 [uncultured Segetibacter sp.]
MEKYNVLNDVKVFGVQVKTFPEGIGEAFDDLLKMLPEGFNRSFYGISEMTEKGFVYKAVAEEKHDNEANIYNCERSIIEKGEYLVAPVRDWRKKTDSIKYVFQEMMHNSSVDKTRPCIEWYINNDEMWCMVKSKN